MSTSRSVSGTERALQRAELAIITYLMNEEHFTLKGNKNLISRVAILLLRHYNS